MNSGAADRAAGTLTTIARYLTRIRSAARGEIAAWRSRAGRIPDPLLREHARSTVAEERLNAEAAAVFALLAPARRQRAIVRLTVTWQLLYDYLDTITEQPAPVDPLTNALTLNRALVDTTGPGEEDGYYRHLGRAVDDGGYLAGMVAACRAQIDALPAAEAVRPLLRREAERCAQAQAHTHAAMLTGDFARLAAWAAGHRLDDRLSWTETAAGGISSLAVHALLAAAATPATRPPAAAAIATAYATTICPLSTLLDSLVDLRADAASGNVAYAGPIAYATPAARAAALGTITTRSLAAAERLPAGGRHRSIVVGLAAFYLSAAGARTREAAPAARAVRRALGASAAPAFGALRARRAAARLGGPGLHR